MKYIFLVLCFFIALNVCAQKAYRTLQIGDEVPNVPLQMANYTASKAKLSDFKGKAVILDFWATWCGSCIAAFPKLEHLQDEFKEQLKIILVNTKDSRDDSIKIEGFFKNWKSKNGTDLKLPSVISDVDLMKLFPTKGIPHYVWIDKTGIVRAITSSNDVTSKNIRAFVNGEALDVELKVDLNVNNPLLTNNYLPASKTIFGSIFLKGNLRGVSKSGKEIKREGVVNGVAYYNKTMFQLYFSIVRKIIPGFSSRLMMIEVADRSKIVLDTLKQSAGDWFEQNNYTLETIVPVNQAKQLDEIMLLDLNRYSSYYGTFQKRRIKYLALTSIEKQLKVASKGGGVKSTLSATFGVNQLKNAPVAHLTEWLAEKFDAVVFNETGYEGKVDIDMTGNNSQNFRAYLKKYGLELIEKEKEMEVFVIADDNKN